MTSAPSPASPHPVDAHVGALVRRRRKACGLSQELLAARIGVTFQQVQKYERGTNRISASMLFEMAAALNMPIQAFFEGLPSAGSNAASAGDHAQSLLSAILQCEGAMEMAEGFIRISSPETRRNLMQLVLGLARTEP